jgi:hypothetical protein
MQKQRLTRLIRFVPLALVASCFCGLLLATGCNKGKDDAGSAARKLKVAYLGLT